MTSKKTFAAWFNATMVGNKTYTFPGNCTQAGTVAGGAVFGFSIWADGFADVWDNVALLMGGSRTSATLGEFVTIFCIPYNETGGSFRPVRERISYRYAGDMKISSTGVTGTPNATNPYQLDEHLFHKYNRNISAWGQPGVYTHRTAGDLLSQPQPNRLQALISSDPKDPDYIAWNAVGGRYPRNAPDAVKLAARECDFYKFAGIGIYQLTFRASYLAYANALVSANQVATGEGVEDVTNDDLEAAFFDPKVYLGSVANMNNSQWLKATFQQASKGSTVDDFAPYGHQIAEGGSASIDVYGPNCYGPRCVALLTEMKKSGYTMGS